MRVVVEAGPGELAARPEDALWALAHLAARDGADGEWLSKALRAAGATGMSVPVRPDPLYRVVADFEAAAAEIHHRAMKAALPRIRALLERAAEGASRAEYHDLLGERA